MAQVPRYRESVKPVDPLPRVDLSSGAAETFSAIADFTGRLGNRIGKLADKAAAREGELDGLKAGVDREFRPARDGTIRGEARDRAGLQMFMELTEADIRGKLDAVAVKHRANPDALAAAIDELQGKTFAELDPGNDFPELRGPLTAFFARARTTETREALRAFEADRKDRVRAAIEAGLTAKLNSAGRAAQINGLDAGADEVLAGELQSIKATLDGAVASGAISATEAGRLFIEAKQDVTINRVQGTLSRLTGEKEKAEFLKQFKTDYEAGKGPLAELAPDKFQALYRTIEISAERDATDTRRLANELDDGWKAMEDAAAQGLPPKTDALAKQRTLANATGDELILARAAQAEAAIGFARDLQTRRPAELEILQRRLQEKATKEGLSPFETRQMETVEKVQSAMDKALKSDPYQWGLRAGILSEDVSISWAGDAATISSLQTRRQAWRTMTDRYGTVSFFTDAERNGLKTVAAQGGAQLQHVANALVTALGEDAHLALKDISGDAPVLANLAGLVGAGGNPNLAMEVGDVLQLKNTDGYKEPAFNGPQMTQASGDLFGAAYLADASSQMRVEATARLLFEKRARQAGVTNFDLEANGEARELWNRALDEAAGASWPGGVKHGGIAIVNGGKVIAPPDMAADDVEARLQALTDDDLKALPAIASANRMPVKAAELQRARLVNVGNGLYRVALGDPQGDDPRYVTAKAGDFWVLDIRKLKMVQAGRTVRPQKFTGRGAQVWKR